MTKKIISAVSALAVSAVLTVPFVPFTHAQTGETENYISYTDNEKVRYKYITENGGAVIVKISSRTGTVEIPDTIDGYPVIGIGTEGMYGQSVLDGEYAFDTNRRVKKIVIPRGVTRLGTGAFSDFKGLTEAVLPDTLESIGDECFELCSSLKSIDIPDSVKSIGNDCFYECVSLKEAKLPSGITELRDQLFYGCRALKSITIPETVTKIEGSFSHCTSLSEVVWNSDNVKDISYWAFYNTPWLTNYPEEYILTDNGTNLYKYTGSAEEFRIPGGVTRVQEGAFQQSPDGKSRCTLKKVILPSCFGKVTEGMFNGMEKLEETVFEGDVRVVGKDSFSGCGFEEFTVPDGVEYINDGAFSGCKNLKTIRLPDGLVHIGSECFKGCESLENIVLPESLEDLGTEIFRNCPGLKILNIPVKAAGSVKQHTFWADKLERVIYGGELTNDVYSSVPKKAWEDWDLSCGDFIIVENTVRGYRGSDRNVVIPEGITRIGSKAFMHADIDTVSFPKSLEAIDKYAFYTCGLTEAVIPKEVKTVGEMAFAECGRLKRVVIDDGVDVGTLAFAYCEQLDDVSAGNNVRFAPDAFDDTPYQRRTNPKEGDIIPDETAKPLPAEAPVVVHAPVQQPEPVFEVCAEKDGLGIKINNSAVVFTDAKPFIDENNRTQLPLRAVTEALGCRVDYDAVSGMVTVKGNGADMIIKIGERDFISGGKTINMDTEARIVNDRTYIPARFVAEALGYSVKWRK